MRRGLARAAAWDALVARLTASVKASIGDTAVDVGPAPPPVSGLGAVFSGLMQHVGWSEGGKTCTAAPCEPYVRTGRLHTLDVLAAQRARLRERRECADIALFLGGDSGDEQQDTGEAIAERIMERD